jgi:hypothetical protein
MVRRATVEKEICMTRLLALVSTAAFVTAIGVGVSAQGSKTMNAQGTVSTVTTSSLAVKGTSESWTFVVDKDTEVQAKGASHKSLAMKADGKSSVLTDFVKVGDRVSVSYHDMGKVKHAATINVTAPTAPK